ncbi:MAG: dephospho-CoA kinase [Actinobacteria bacterium]|nr:dephospho-CoA kinase [Actinomycetota bacterium]NBY15110.1 dephospho-CoA kinase [Actinomycetota bacterium]
MIVALTGGIGAGKTTVAQLFASLGAFVVDADDLARQALLPGSPLIPEVAQRFGAEVIVDGEVDRQALANIVFNDEQALRDLEAMIHPDVARRLQAIHTQLNGEQILIYAIPLLTELGLKESFDAVVVVTCDLQIRKDRLLARGMNSADIEARIAAQATDEQRNAQADFLLDNSGDIAGLERQVADVWDSLSAYA